MLLPEGPSPPSTPPVPVVGVKVFGVVEPELEPGVVDVGVDEPGGLLLVLLGGLLLLLLLLLLLPLVPAALRGEHRCTQCKIK